MKAHVAVRIFILSNSKLKPALLDGEKYELQTEDTYVIPGNQIHSFKVIEAGEVIDVFTPLRQGYI